MNATNLTQYTTPEILRRRNSARAHLSAALAETADEQCAYRDGGSPHSRHLKDRADALNMKLEECNTELQRRAQQS